MIAFNAIHAEITWYLSDNGTLTISGTNMRNYSNSDSDYTPWYRQRNQIKKVVIENGVTNIGARAFSPCANLTSVTIPESVMSIGASVFYGCEGLTSIAIPNSVTNIGSGAFMGCPGLNSINIPNSVTSIGSAAFYGCVALKSITIPNSVTNIESFAFSGCKTLTSVTIPNTVTSIGNNAFGYCSGLKSVTIPNSVTNIEEEAFRDCPSLTSVTIPESVTSIGNNAFSNCPGLTSITCKAVTPPNCYNYNFYQVNKSIPVYVPANSIGAYKTTNGWRDFENIQAIIEPENISFSQTNERLALGSTKTLTAIIAPENATNKIITWTSSNTAVATVSSEGIVTAKNLGTTIITAKTYNDKSATCEITVEQAVTSITLSEATVSLWVGNTKALTATVTPTTASNPAVNWSSSNNNVATVSSQGVITAKGKGTCTITCTAADGYGTKSTCEVTVKEPVTSIVLSDVSNSIWVGENKAITATASPTTASNTSVSWSSSDNSVATVSSKGVITAKGKGTCTITCTAADGYGAKSTCEVTVKQQVTEITLNETAVSLWLGDTKTLTATTTPTTANNTNVSWSSSDDKVATVSSKGIITAKGKGTCTITCTAADGYGTKSTCSLTVKQQVTEISLSETTVSLWVGDTKNITATATPTTANNTAVTWSSSNNSVATVSSKGGITAKGKGTCTITCTAADGCGTKSTCEVSVKQQVAEIALSETTASLWIGNTKTFTATISPTTANNTAVSWSSSNNNVATVSSKGVITAKGKGTCTITCTAADGYGTKTTCEITVKQQVTEIALSETTVSLWVGDTKALTATATPTTANNTNVTWSSSDDKVASVSSEGVITTNGEGTCTITCTAADGHGTSSNCEVIVMQKETSIEEIQIVNEDSPIYSLNGQRINKAHAQKGVYIKNGKKYAK